MTKKLEEKRIMPSSVLNHFFRDCHSFDLSLYTHEMRRLEVTSNFSVNALFHDIKQKKIHMQLSTFIQIEGFITIL